MFVVGRSGHRFTDLDSGAAESRADIDFRVWELIQRDLQRSAALQAFEVVEDSGHDVSVLSVAASWHIRSGGRFECSHSLWRYGHFLHSVLLKTVARITTDTLTNSIAQLVFSLVSIIELTCLNSRPLTQQLKH